MAPTFDAVVTQESNLQQAYAHVYDEKNAGSKKSPTDKQNRHSLDIEVVALDGDDDIIRESGMSL